ncbi:flagellar export chaperone FliS [Rhizorhabdus histidinilytica]|uniref:flagellar export chaperone FliS n=1 Tax=Rhizorhabdus histidinilytica TaxID=439228 RepID=UPI001F406651|nr:flagellar protein FliS [Rhizorhabdus histidinilytica]
MNGAKLRYQTVDVDSRVEGASPHRLIGILFEELMKALEIMTAAQRAGMTAKAIDKQARASNILLALETSLDYRNGGEIAVNLAKIYREARRLVRLGGRDNQPELVDRARAYLAEIVEAWEAIG